MITKDILKKLDADEILKAIGLERTSSSLTSMLPTLGGFGIGILVGAALGLAFAPKTGSETRTELADRFGDLKTRFNNGESVDKAS
ncbi:MAG: YtxH domain-containing protein [Clostridia bacterium]|nr:YtxH domain-containing protein [Deltaproteobacteria bacterium]